MKTTEVHDDWIHGTQGVVWPATQPPDWCPISNTPWSSPEPATPTVSHAITALIQDIRVEVEQEVGEANIGMPDTPGKLAPLVRGIVESPVREVVVSPGGRVVVSPVGGVVVSLVGRVVVSPVSGVMVSPGGKVVVSPEGRVVVSPVGGVMVSQVLGIVG